MKLTINQHGRQGAPAPHSINERGSRGLYLHYNPDDLLIQDHSISGEARRRPDGVSAGQRRLLLHSKKLAVPPVGLPRSAPADGRKELGTVLGA